jgi:hypothetical protein
MVPEDFIEIFCFLKITESYFKFVVDVRNKNKNELNNNEGNLLLLIRAFKF